RGGGRFGRRCKCRTLPYNSRRVTFGAGSGQSSPPNRLRRRPRRLPAWAAAVEAVIRLGPPLPRPAATTIAIIRAALLIRLGRPLPRPAATTIAIIRAAPPK